MATKANLLIDQGTDYTTSVTLTDNNGDPIDITGYTGASQMRKSYTSSTYYAFNVAIDGPIGKITLTMSANTTSGISPGRYLYDVELTDVQNHVSRVFEGIVTVTPNITRG